MFVQNCALSLKTTLNARTTRDALVTMMNMELATPTYEFVAEKM